LSIKAGKSVVTSYTTSYTGLPVFHLVYNYFHNDFLIIKLTLIFIVKINISQFFKNKSTI
jgi:hypothetical protein